MSGFSIRLAELLGRAREALAGAVANGLAWVLPRVPTDAALLFADALGTLAWLLDRRGRGIGRENLAAVFGDTKTPRERARILRASYRNALRCEVLLFHLQPMTPARYERWVYVAPDHVEVMRTRVAEGWRGVIVAAHLGNWELALAARTALSFAPSFAFLVESTGSRALDQVLDRLRDRGSGGAALRKSGALALRRALAEGRSVSFLIDRNVRGQHGGDYVPFLGLQARTTPLGAMLARAYSVPLVVALMTPHGRRRWRFSLSGDLMPPPSADPRADIRTALTRANDMLSEAILKHPETWVWTLKRFKSRPTAERGRYPPYSFHDPEAAGPPVLGAD